MTKASDNVPREDLSLVVSVRIVLIAIFLQKSGRREKLKFDMHALNNTRWITHSTIFKFAVQLNEGALIKENVFVTVSTEVKS